MIAGIQFLFLIGFRGVASNLYMARFKKTHTLENLLIAIQNSFIAVVPYLLVSASLVLATTFFSAYDLHIGMLTPELLSSISISVSSFYALVLTFAFAYHLSRTFNQNFSFVCLLSLLCFVVYNAIYNKPSDAGIIYVPAESVLIGILIPFIVVVCFPRFCNVFGYAAKAEVLLSSQLKQTFSYLIPFFFTFFSVLLVLSVLHSIKDVVLSYLFSPVEIGHLGAEIRMMIRCLVSHLLWFFGVHGDLTYDALFQTDFMDVELVKNLTYKEFYDMFVLYGGVGSILSMIIAIFLFSKSLYMTRIAKMAAPFACFNISEILIYGIPLALNPFFIVPFFLVPVINFLIAYSFIRLDLIAFTDVNLSWTTPVFIDTYFVTDQHLLAGGLQLFCILLGVVIYAPFVKRYSVRQSTRAQLKKLEDHFGIATGLEANSDLKLNQTQKAIIKSHAEVSETIDLILKNELHVFYQPKFSVSSGKLQGVEALLRIEIEEGEIVGPFFLDNIEYVGMAPLIDMLVVKQVQEDIVEWAQQGLQFCVSVNLHPDTLCEDRMITEIIERFSGKNVEFEIVERGIIDNQAAKENVNRLRNCGFRIALDDFGVGYSSLETLYSVEFDTVKLDKTVIDHIGTKKGLNIMRSIYVMLNQLNVACVFEGVETEEQVRVIKGICAGVCYIQGYYYYPAVPMPMISTLVRNHNVEATADKKVFTLPSVSGQ